jgi:hypothetical protein
MANKYSNFRLKQIQSNYVDSGSVDVNKILKDRFDQNKASHDLIDRSLASLEVMEGDKANVERVKGDVRNTLQEISTNGNYEDASLAVADAANLVETDKGLIAAQSSMKNRSMELEYIRKARLEGREILDFGKGAASSHVSYFYDKESETFVTDTYEPRSEQMLDYNQEMTGLVKTIKADQGGNWEGITKGKADGVARMIYNNYITSAAGKQDFKRLMELELDPSIPAGDREQLAKNDIMKRLKGVTNQYVYDKYTAPKGDGTKNADGTSSMMFKSTRNSSASAPIKSVKKRSADALNIIKNTEKKSTEQVQLELDNLERSNAQATYQAALQLANGDTDHAKRIVARQTAKDKMWSNVYKEDGVKLNHLVEMITAHTSESDSGDEREAMAKNIVIAGASGAATGAAVGALGGPIGAAGGTVLGGFIGMVKGTYDIYMGDDTFRNVIDWQRNDAIGGHWTDFMSDTEEQQLWEEVLGKDAEDGKYDVSKINRALGTNFKNSDGGKIKEMLTASLVHKYGKEGEVSGHDIDKHLKENAAITDVQGWSLNSTPEGNKYKGYIDKTLQKTSPRGMFMMQDGDTKSNWDEWVGEDGENWGKVEFLRINEGSARENVPTSYTLGINGKEKVVQVKDQNDAHTRGFLHSVTSVVGMGNLQDEERYRLYVNNWNATHDVQYTHGQDIDRWARNRVIALGGDEADVASTIKKEEDFRIQDSISADKAAPGFSKDANNNVFLLNSSGDMVSWKLEDGSYNPAAWSLYEQQYGDVVTSMRAVERSRNYRD